MDASSDSMLPLCVDLDGTLIKIDSLVELFWYCLRHCPYKLIRSLYSLFYGLAYFKHCLAKLCPTAKMKLPFNDDFLEYLKKEHQLGRKIYLVTATNVEFARRIVSPLNIFEEVIGSSENINLKGINKANKLKELFGEKGFEYAGNSKVDLAVWKVAGSAIVVNAPTKVVKKLKNMHPDHKFFDLKKGNRCKVILRAIRLHQWSKNVLLFVPLLLGKTYLQQGALLHTIIGFWAFCFAAASVYLLNDLLDLDTDRKHHRKRNRPLASGQLSIALGLLLFLLFLVSSILITLFMHDSLFLMVMGIYYISTLLYSFVLKKKLLIDVFTLAALYTIRIIAGVIASSSVFSPWLISFSIFFFMSLAFVKRYSELFSLKALNKRQMLDKAYHDEDMKAMSVFGITSGYAAIVVLLLYIQSDAVFVLYHHPLWLCVSILAMLFWVNRIWLLTMRGLVNEDPVLYALKDRVSWGTAFVIMLGFCLGSFL